MQIIIRKNVAVIIVIAARPLKFLRYAFTGLLHTINGTKQTLKPNNTDDAAIKNQLPLVYIQQTAKSTITLAVNEHIVRNILFLGAINGTTKIDVGISIAASTMKNHPRPLPLARSTIMHISIGRAKIAAKTLPITALLLLKNLDHFHLLLYCYLH